MQSKLSDISFSTIDFLHSINSELVGKIVNLGSRSINLLHKTNDGVLPEMTERGKEMLAQTIAKKKSITDLMEERDFGKAMIMIREIAEETNKYFDEKTPWKLEVSDAAPVLSDAIHLFRAIIIYLSPIMPKMTLQVAEMFGEQAYTYHSLNTTLVGKTIAKYSQLATRIQPDQLDQLTAQKKF